MCRHSSGVQTVGFLTVRRDGMLRWSCGVLRAQREASQRGCARERSERIWAHLRVAGSGSSGRCNLGPKAGTVTSAERFLSPRTAGKVRVAGVLLAVVVCSQAVHVKGGRVRSGVMMTGVPCGWYTHPPSLG